MTTSVIISWLRLLKNFSTLTRMMSVSYRVSATSRLPTPDDGHYTHWARFARPKTIELAHRLWAADDCEFAKLSCLHSLKRIPEAHDLFPTYLLEFENTHDTQNVDYLRSHMAQLRSSEDTMVSLHHKSEVGTSILVVLYSPYCSMERIPTSIPPNRYLVNIPKKQRSLPMFRQSRSMRWCNRCRSTWAGILRKDRRGRCDCACRSSGQSLLVGPFPQAVAYCCRRVVVFSAQGLKAVC